MDDQLVHAVYELTDSLARVTEERDTLRKQRDEAVRLLRKKEWVWLPDGIELECLFCGESKTNHTIDCELGGFLATLKSGGGNDG